MGAADYCLGREPLFFWNTMMFVENFHWYSPFALPLGEVSS